MQHHTQVTDLRTTTVNDSIKKLILVADDDEMNREIMEAFLTSENYKVNLAHNGATAIRIATTSPPDLIILDVKMSDMNGYDVCKILRREDQTRQTPIMIVTGFDSLQDRQQADLAGATLFYPRPFDGDNFLATVAELLPD